MAGPGLSLEIPTTCSGPCSIGLLYVPRVCIVLEMRNLIFILLLVGCRPAAAIVPIEPETGLDMDSRAMGRARTASDVLDLGRAQGLVEAAGGLGGEDILLGECFFTYPND